ncbi:MAG: hypothetical protein RLZZ546_3116, partial [Bacteroidota bacterium]
ESESKKINFKYIETLGTHLATNKVIRFLNVPKINFTNGKANISVKVTADHDNLSEYFEIRGEDGSLVGRTNSGTACKEVISQFEVSKNLYNTWASDGIVEFTAVANNEAAEEGKGINPCNAINPNQSLDQSSTIDITLEINNPKIQYSIDLETKLNNVPENGQFLKVGLEGGKHVVNFIVSDNFGNTTTCRTMVEIRDSEKPIAFCKNFIARIHPSGLIDYVLSPDSINNMSIDNCEIDSIWTIESKFTCAQVGTEKEIELYVRDKNKNTATCKSRVRIENMKLTPSFTAGLCSGDTLKLFSNLPLPSQSSNYSIEWYKDNTLVSIAENPIFPNSDITFNGLYNLRVKGFNNCMSEGVLNINIKPLSTPTIETSQESYCDNTEITLKTNSFSGLVSYDWYEGFPPNGVLKSTTTSPELGINPSIGVHNYYVIAKNSSCISNPSLTERVIIYKKPEVQVNNVFQNKCEGDDIILGTTTTGNQFIYNWSGPDGFMSNVANPPVIKNIDINKQGKYQLVVRIGECTSDTAATTIIVIPKPEKPVISGEPIYCEGKTFTLQVNNIPLQEKYTWYKNGVRFRVTNDNSIEITNASTSLDGEWSVVVESNGCISDTSIRKNVEIDDLSTIGADNNGPLCEGDTVFLTSTTVPNATYKWEGPKEFQSINQNTKTLALEGEYFVTITSSSGCENITSTFVRVNKTPTITALSNNSLSCMDGKTAIEFFPTVIPEGNYTYEWVGKNFTSNIKNARIENADTSDNGEYVLTVLNEGCPSKKVKSIVNINLIPQKANFDLSQSVCEGDDLTLMTNSIADTFIWNTPFGIFKTVENKLNIKNTGQNAEGNFFLLVNDRGCLSKDFTVKSLVVKDRPLPAGIIGDNDLCFREDIKLSVNNSNVDAVIWIKPDGSQVTTTEYIKQSANKNDEGNYKSIIIKDGCKSIESNPFFLKIRDEIEVPILDKDKIDICSNENSLFEVCVKNHKISNDYNYIYSIKDNNPLIGQTKAPCISLSTNLFSSGENVVQVKATKEGCESLNANALIKKTTAPNIKAEANISETTICDEDDFVELKLNNISNVEAEWTNLTQGIDIFSPKSVSTLAGNFKKGINVIVLSISEAGCKNFSRDTIYVYLNEIPKTKNDDINVGFNDESIIDILANDMYNNPF